MGSTAGGDFGMSIGAVSAPIHAGSDKLAMARSGRRAVPSRGSSGQDLQLHTAGLGNPFGSKPIAVSNSEEKAGPTSPKGERQALRMQTFGLGSDGVFGGCEASSPQGQAAGMGLSKGERISACGQFIIDADGNWKPNVVNPPTRRGARDPTDPIQTTREKEVKHGRRATPTGGSKYRQKEQRRVVRPPKDSRFDEVL